MRKKKKANSVTISLFIILLLLISFSNLCIAENIPISEEGIKKIGKDKIRLESGIGVLVFELEKIDDKITGEGYLTLSNTYNDSAIIECKLIGKLSPLDLDENGNPRIHKIVSDKIVFDKIPTLSWISLEDDNARINPYSVYNFRYHVEIPITSETSFNESKGYLIYINVRKTLENATGANIGIDYNYKLFLIFKGELDEGFILSTYQMMMIPIPIFVGGIIFSVYKRKKNKKKIKAPKAPKAPIKVQAENNIINDKPVVTKSAGNSDLIENKIDLLFEKHKKEGYERET